MFRGLARGEESAATALAAVFAVPTAAAALTALGAAPGLVAAAAWAVPAAAFVAAAAVREEDKRKQKRWNRNP